MNCVIGSVVYAWPHVDPWMIDLFPSVRLTRVDSDELVVIIYDEWAPGRRQALRQGTEQFILGAQVIDVRVADESRVFR